MGSWRRAQPRSIPCALPAGDADYAARWRAIKVAFSKSVPRTERLSTVRATRGERGIWQRRYWEHTIRDEGDYAAHMDYLHFKPVKHGHVSRTGRIPCFTGLPRRVCMPWIGRAMATKTGLPEERG